MQFENSQGAALKMMIPPLMGSNGNFAIILIGLIKNKWSTKETGGHGEQ